MSRKIIAALGKLKYLATKTTEDKARVIREFRFWECPILNFGHSPKFRPQSLKAFLSADRQGGAQRAAECRRASTPFPKVSSMV